MEKAFAGNMDLSKMVKAAKLGSNSFNNEVKEASLEFRQLVSMMYNGIRYGSDVSKDVELFNSAIERKKSVERLVMEKTEGMHAVSQLGITFFFPMFAGISSGIMQNALGVPAASPISIAFTFSIIAYTGIILLISASFNNPTSKLQTRINSIIPILTTSISVFILSSYLSNIF